MVVQKRDIVPLIKAESLEMRKPGGIKIHVEIKKNRNVYTFDIGPEPWGFSRIMPKLVASAAI